MSLLLKSLAIFRIQNVISMARYIILIITCLGITSCGNDKPTQKEEPIKTEKSELKFDEKLWQTKEGNSYPYRDKMVDDILYSNVIRKLDKPAVLEALGPPSREEKNHLYYIISQNKVLLFTLKEKTLVVKISDDDKVEWIKLHG